METLRRDDGEGDVMQKGKDNAKKTKTKQNVSKSSKDKPKQQPKEEAAVAAGDQKNVKTKTKSKKCMEWESGDNLLRLKDWVRRGSTMKQVAENIGISMSTLYEWMRLSSEISETIKKGKDIPDILVENALLTAALEGNTTAQIFWLKNRRPDLWRDKTESRVEAEVENTGGVVICAPRMAD